MGCCTHRRWICALSGREISHQKAAVIKATGQVVLLVRSKLLLCSYVFLYSSLLLIHFDLTHFSCLFITGFFLLVGFSLSRCFPFYISLRISSLIASLNLLLPIFSFASFFASCMPHLCSTQLVVPLEINEVPKQVNISRHISAAVRILGCIYVGVSGETRLRQEGRLNVGSHRKERHRLPRPWRHRCARTSNSGIKHVKHISTRRLEYGCLCLRCRFQRTQHSGGFSCETQRSVVSPLHPCAGGRRACVVDTVELAVPTWLYASSICLFFVCASRRIHWVDSSALGTKIIRREMEAAGVLKNGLAFPRGGQIHAPAAFPFPIERKKRPS